MKREILLAYICLAGVSLIWGTTYLGIRIGVEHFPPFLFVVLRQLLAGIILLGFLYFFKKEKLPTRAQWLEQLPFGFLMIMMGNGLVSWSEVNVSSGLAAIICSTMPMMVVLLNVLVYKEEKANFLIVLGVLLGLGGIVMIFGEHLADFTNTRYSLGIFLIFVATTSWAVGSMMSKKRKSSGKPMMNAALQMFTGGLCTIPFSLAFDSYEKVSFTPQATWALLYLIIVGSVIAFAMYIYAITYLPVSLVSIYSYINPIIAVILGALILDEVLNWRIGVAIAVTVAGIYLMNVGNQRQKNKIG